VDDAEGEEVKFVSLFAGIGGLDLGLENAGWDCVTQVENDEWCTSILEKHWPEVPKYGDVSDVPGSALPACDAIVGGFPCQPVSLVGRREGQSDPRWLWPHFARLVDEIQPRIVVVENVPGLRSLGGSEVLADLAAMGYDHQWGELSAASVGAPHLRQRFVLVAYPRGERRQQDPRSAPGYEGKDAWWAKVSDHVVGSSVTFDRGPEWPTEPRVDRVVDGFPGQVDQLRGLGNAVVPQVGEAIGRWVNAHLTD
jgi:DNA (cytosine-5)-methyltransferase 1